MKEFKILKLLDSIQFFYKKLGVNYSVMRKILQLKLIMDERRIPTIFKQNEKKGEENLFKKSLLMYALTGVFLAIFIPLSFPLFYKMNLIFGMLIFLVMSVMISDYSSVLLDVQEKNILLPKPVDVKTINAAKVTHIIYYLMSILLVIAGPSLIFGSIRYGLVFGAIYMVELILILGLVIFLTAILYFLILQFFDGERLKDIINFFQIILAIVMMLVYQLIGRVFEVVDLNVIFVPKWWSYLLPSTWFAAPYMLLLEGNREPHYLIMTLLGVVIPLALLVSYFKGIAPYFERNLQKLNNHSQRKNKGGTKIGKGIAGFFSYNPVERSAFRFSQAMLRSERSLKLKIYPTLAFAAVAPLILLFGTFTESHSFVHFQEQIASGKSYLMIYVSMILLCSSLVMLNTSEKHQGAWLYRALPIENPGAVIKGALKAFVAKMLLPPFLFICLLYLLIYGTVIVIPHLLLVILNFALLIVIIFNRSDRSLPFSEDFDYIKHNSTVMLFISILFCGISAALHWGLGANLYHIGIYMGLVAIITLLLWKRSFRFTWKDLE